MMVCAAGPRPWRTVPRRRSASWPAPHHASTKAAGPGVVPVALTTAIGYSATTFWASGIATPWPLAPAARRR